MQAIQAPIHPGESGPQVANLQDALRLLLERDHICSRDPESPTADELAQLGQQLAEERANSTYGTATQCLVAIVQIQERLGDNPHEVVEAKSDKKLDLHGQVESKTAEKLNQWLKELWLLDSPEPDGFIVQGTVNTSDGKPVPGVVVRAFDRDMRKEQLLDEAEADGQGQYIIRYGAEQFAAGDATTASAPWLIVRAFAGEQQIGTDVVRKPAEREEIVNFELPAPALSEWERLSAGVMPLLVGQGEDDQTLPPWEVNDRDIDFIVDETGLDREQVRLWALAFAVGSDPAAECGRRMRPAR